MDRITVTEKLDLRGVLCPMNFVKTKLKLEEMQPKEFLELILDEGEPMRSVPRSLEAEGHQIIKVEEFEKAFKLIIQKA